MESKLAQVPRQALRDKLETRGPIQPIFSIGAQAGNRTLRLEETCQRSSQLGESAITDATGRLSVSLESICSNGAGSITCTFWGFLALTSQPARGTACRQRRRAYNLQDLGDTFLSLHHHCMMGSPCQSLRTMRCLVTLLS